MSTPLSQDATLSMPRVDLSMDASNHQVHVPPATPEPLAELKAVDVSAWFGDHKVLERVNLTMHPGEITALIGPSGCGKSTFLRILNRMHELVPIASLSGQVLLDGEDIYDATMRITRARRDIGMVFQKPNPFPAMSIRDNVLAGLKLTGKKATKSEKDDWSSTASSSAACGTRSRTVSTPPAAACRAVSSSGCASPAPWRSSRGCCSWTSPARRSTPRRPGSSRRR